MSFDDELRKELQQRLDPIGSGAEWDPVRERLAGARARRDRTRAAIAGTVAASLALGGIALAWTDRDDPVSAASHPISPSPSPSAIVHPERDARSLPPVEAAVALPPGRECPAGWRFFVNPVLGFDHCYPDDWGFSGGRDRPFLEALTAADLRGGVTLSSPAYPFDGQDAGAFDPYRVLLTMFQTSPHRALEGCEELALVNATGRWCERTVDPGIDIVEVTKDGPVRTLSFLAPLRTEYAGADVRPGVGSQLQVAGEARRELWDEHRDTIFTILRSIRMHDAPPPDELTLPLELLEADGPTLRFMARPGACGTVDRIDVNETPTGVWVRGIGPRPPVAVGTPFVPCDARDIDGREIIVELDSPLGSRTLHYAMVSPIEFGGDKAVQGCSELFRADEPGEGWATPSEALRFLLDTPPFDASPLDIGQLAVFSGSEAGPGEPSQRGWVHREGGRTTFALSVYLHQARGWVIGDAGLCLS